MRLKVLTVVALIVLFAVVIWFAPKDKYLLVLNHPSLGCVKKNPTTAKGVYLSRKACRKAGQARYKPGKYCCLKL